MQTTKKATLKDLVLDPKNANMHSEYGSGLLENSTRMNGLGRSILISNDNVVIAGNGLTEAAAKIGMDDVEIVETDGHKIIAVKRTDIKSGTPEFYNMALADNITALKNIVMNPEVVEAIIVEHPETKFWGTIVADEKETRTDPDKAGKQEMSFELSGWQASAVKKALKLAKGKLKGDKSNSAALVLIAKQFISQTK
jgi:hypothetical protein